MTGQPLTLPLTLPLARGGDLDRAAHRRRDEAWLAGAWATARVLVLTAGTALVRGTPTRAELVLVGPQDVPQDVERYFLGVDAEDQAYFAVVVPGPSAAAAVPGGASVGAPGQAPGEAAGVWAGGLREVGPALGERDAAMLATVVALANWHARHGFSPVDGGVTRLAEAGWSRDSGGGQLWPRTDPAVIALVHDGRPGPAGRCLLASNVAWPQVGGQPRYSCLAGFVEPGESAEQAVAREIAEEVGVTVDDVRYLASQPWPFPGSLMLGFMAVADPAERLRLAPDEIADARWFTRAEVGAALCGSGNGFTLPPGLSIARYLMTTWSTRSTATVE